MATTVDTKNLNNLWKKFKNITEEEKHAKLSEWGKKGYTSGKEARSIGRANAALQRRTMRWINTSVEMAINNFAQQVQYDIRFRFLQVIDWFYADYSPQMYERTGSLEYAYKPTLEKSGNIYTFGAVLDTGLIPSNAYHSIYKSHEVTDPAYVFDRFYNSGWHGDDIVHIGWKAPQMTPQPPKYYMHDWWNGYLRTAQRKFNTEFTIALEKNKKLLKG